MPSYHGKNIVLTGVSSGIGKGTCRYLAARGFRIFGSVRKAADAKDLEAELGEAFVPLIFDVCNADDIGQAVYIVSKAIGDDYLKAIINNAGLALFGPMESLENDAFEHIMRVNVMGARLVTNAFLPLMRNGQKADNRKIINISSLSGIFNTPMNGAYCVSKHAMESLGEIYRRELLPEGIDVVSIRSGPIQTEIWRKNIEEDERFDGTLYENMARRSQRIMHHAKKEALPPEVIAELVFGIISGRKKKLSYHVGSGSRIARLLSSQFLPKRMVDKLIVNSLNKPKV